MYKQIFKSKSISILLVIIILSACSGRTGAEKKKAESPRIKKQSEKGPVQITVSVDTDEISLAGMTEYTLEVKCEKGYTAELPAFNDRIFGGLIVKDKFSSPKIYPDTMTTIISERYTLEPIVSGNFTIAPMLINFTEDNDTRVYSLESKPIEIKVSSLLDTAGQIPAFRDSLEPLSLKRNYKKLFRNIGIAAIIIIIAAGIILFYLKKKKKIVFTFKPKKSADEIAYEQLRELVELQLIEKGEYKEFYYRISFIFRLYLENRFSLKAPEQTTEEFIIDIYNRTLFEKDTQNILKEFMEFSDLVKYEKYKPEKTDIQKSFYIVKNFIEKTKEAK